jgi:hypothetical protein
MMDDAALRRLGDRIRLLVDRTDASEVYMARVQERIGPPAFLAEQLAHQGVVQPDGEIVFPHAEALARFMAEVAVSISVESASVLLDLLEEAGPK